MIRMSEAVLPGHPDRFSDQVADAIVAAAYAVDPRAYCQVEVSVWSDQVNDQCISIGWAGYDAQTGYLPPEHCLVQHLCAALAASCAQGTLEGEGPDGKLLVRVRESSESWALESLLVTLQQREATRFGVFVGAVRSQLAAAYHDLQRRDRRWSTPFDEVDLLINPNGPLLNGGSDGDNGQTGRKLVVDYYGPRVPSGGVDARVAHCYHHVSPHISSTRCIL